MWSELELSLSLYERTKEVNSPRSDFREAIIYAWEERKMMSEAQRKCVCSSSIWNLERGWLACLSCHCKNIGGPCLHDRWILKIKLKAVWCCFMTCRISFMHELSLSLSHTHRHTHTHTLSLSLSYSSIHLLQISFSRWLNFFVSCFY